MAHPDPEATATNRPVTRVRLAPPVRELIFHGLSFIPVPEGAPPSVHAASLFREPYLEWAHRALPRSTVAPFEEIGAALSQMSHDPAVAFALQAFASWYDDEEAFLAEGGRLLREIEGRPRLSSILERPIEIFRASCLLSLEDFAGWYREASTPLLAWWAAPMGFDLTGCSLGEVELAACLGPNGRLLSGLGGASPVVVVGTSGNPFLRAPSEEERLRTGALCFHERAVFFATELGEASWARVEALALEAGRRAPKPARLREAYHRWGASLDRSGLAELTSEDEAVLDGLVLRLTEASEAPRRGGYE